MGSSIVQFPESADVGLRCTACKSRILNGGWYWFMVILCDACYQSREREIVKSCHPAGRIYHKHHANHVEAPLQEFLRKKFVMYFGGRHFIRIDRDAYKVLCQAGYRHIGTEMDMFHASVLLDHGVKKQVKKIQQLADEWCDKRWPEPYEAAERTIRQHRTVAPAAPFALKARGTRKPRRTGRVRMARGVGAQKPLLYDLCSKAGGAGYGYKLAGFRVIGIDIEPQPRYKGDGFIQMDAIEFLKRYIAGEFPAAAFFHASPPCQTHTQLNNIKRIKALTQEKYTDLIAPMRELLKLTGKPYVIENVKGAPLEKPIELCGSFFPELKVYRHRYFESSWELHAPFEHTPHRDKTPSAGRGVSPKGYISINAGGNWNIPEGYTPKGYKSMAMGIDWMTADELTEAIPPVYTQYIGAEWLRQNGYPCQYPTLRNGVQGKLFEQIGASA